MDLTTGMKFTQEKNIISKYLVIIYITKNYKNIPLFTKKKYEKLILLVFILSWDNKSVKKNIESVQGNSTCFLCAKIPVKSNTFEDTEYTVNKLRIYIARKKEWG
jgi:hypothetical protein